MSQLETCLLPSSLVECDKSANGAMLKNVSNGVRPAGFVVANQGAEATRSSGLIQAGSETSQPNAWRASWAITHQDRGSLAPTRDTPRSPASTQSWTEWCGTSRSVT